MMYKGMTQLELQEDWNEELVLLKDVCDATRYRWLSKLGSDEIIQASKLDVVRGYLMAIRDLGHNIGALKVIAEYLQDYAK